MGIADTSFTSAPRFRQRKISLKQQLRILWQKDLPNNIEDVRGDLLGIVETGVDKSEEDERHLQAVLNAATSAGKPTDAFIPTPEATKKWPEYSKYYKPGWSETESYIRSSATVEDAQGNEYNMDEEDLSFLESMNAKYTESKLKCCEDEFEMICSLMESVVAEKQPFLSTDPEQLLAYEELEKHIIDKLEDRKRRTNYPLDPERLLLEAQSPDYAPKLVGSPNRSFIASVKMFGSSIYQHWRQRKIARHGKSVFPTLKFESGLASDDSDPYVCFRHREIRHSRKTRRTDQQNSGRLRKLHSEMLSAQSIFELILKRERKRLQQIQTDFEVFEMRCRVKALKRKLKIGQEPGDVDLFVSVPKRVRQEEQARIRREESENQRRAQLAKEKQERDRERRESAREAARESSKEPRNSTSGAAAAVAEARKATVATANGSRIPDLEHVTVEQQMADRDLALEQAVAEKLRQRRESEIGWVNMTENIHVPYTDYFQSPLLSPPEDDTGSDWMSVDETTDNNNRLKLPIDTIGEADSPEIIQIDEPDLSLETFSDIDFLRNPDKFSVPRGAPQAFCRRRVFGNLTHIDRIIPASENPLALFGKKLAQSQNEEDERLVDRYRFDHDYNDASDSLEELRNDPARLNGIEPITQSLRFNAMLTAKAGELLAEAQHQRRRAMQAMVKRQQAQQQQRATAEAQAQHNAQMQTQNNLRLQQGQRAIQRQQQRKKVPGQQGSPSDNSSSEQENKPFSSPSLTATTTASNATSTKTATPSINVSSPSRNATLVDSGINSTSSNHLNSDSINNSGTANSSSVTNYNNMASSSTYNANNNNVNMSLTGKPTSSAQLPSPSPNGSTKLHTKPVHDQSNDKDNEPNERHTGKDNVENTDNGRLTPQLPKVEASV